MKYTLFTLFILLGFSTSHLFAGATTQKNPPDECDTKTETCCGEAEANGGGKAPSATQNQNDACDDDTGGDGTGGDNTGGGAGNACIMVQFGMGRTTPYTDRTSVALKVFALESTPAIFTPESLYLVMGYTFNRIGSPRLRNGTPQEVIITHPQGEPIYFKFKEGESLAIPDPGIHIDLNERLHMVDAEGWATLDDPAYYDLYPGDGTRYRFLATNITGERGKFISMTNARGHVFTEEDYGLSIIRNQSGLRQVVTPSRFADLQLRSDELGYDLTIYPIQVQPEVDPTTGLYIVPTDVTPAHKMTLRQGKRDNGSIIDNTAIVTLQKGEQPVQVYTYKYISGDWELEYPSGIKEIKEKILAEDQGAHLITKELSHTGTLLSKSESFFDWRDWGYAKTSTTKGYGDATSITQWTYYLDGINKGKLKTKTLNDGQTFSYEYDTKGRITKSTKHGCQEITFTSYDPLVSEDAIFANDDRPRRIYKTHHGVEVARVYYVYTPTQVIRERCAESEASYGAIGNLRTVMTYYPADDVNPYHAGRLKSTRYEDGSIDLLTYDLDNTGLWIETRTKLHEQAMTPISGKTMRIIAILNAAGYVVEKRREVWLNSTWPVVSKESNTFNLEGRLTQSANLSGQVTKTTWGCCEKIATFYPDGTVVRYAYDSEQRLIAKSQKAPLSLNNESFVSLHLEWDALGRIVTTWQSGDDGATVTPKARIEYDILGRVIAQIDPLGNKTGITYSKTGNTETTTHPNGATQIATYQNGHRQSIRGTAVTATTYSHGANWTMEASGDRWSKIITNMLGQTIRTEQSSPNDSTRITTYTYDTYGRPLSVEDFGQPITTYTYNNLGEQIARTHTVGETWRRQTAEIIFTQGAPSETSCFCNLKVGTSLTVIFACRCDESIWQSQTTTFSTSDSTIASQSQSTHFRLTRLKSKIPSHQLSIDTRGHAIETWTTFNYETKEGITYQKVPYATNLATIRSKYGQALEKTSLSGIITSSIYDELGRMVSQTDGRENATMQTYNALGQILTTVDAAENATTYGYNDYGQLISVTDALNQTISYEYDLRGRKIYEGGSTYPVRYIYDTFGNPISMTTYRDEEGEGTGDTTTWTYDNASGALLQKRYADGKGWAYTYADNGQPITRMDARGIVTTYTYDDWKQLISTTYSDATPATTFTYDAMGKTTTAQGAVGTTTLTYDTYGALTQEAITGQYTKSITHHVDTYGRNVGYSIDASRQNTLSYDPVTSRMIGMNMTEGDFTWNYLAKSNLKSKLTYPNGATAEWTYEPKRNVLTSITNSLRLSASVINPQVISQYNYTRDAIARRTAMSKSGIMMSMTDTIDYGYNARSEVISADAQQDTNYLFNYAFDDVGNRETGEGKTYTANALNQYTAIGGTAFVPSYDANGNQTLVQTTTGTWTVTYNAEDRPITWTKGTTVITMTYDHMGRRITKTTTQGNTSSVEKFVYNGYLCIQTLSNANAITQSFIWDPTAATATRPLVFTEGEQTSFYMHDGNKNVSDVISSTPSSNDVTHYDYAPFGAVTRTATANISTQNSSPITHNSELRSANPFRFSSEYHDDDLGLVYYNYRHYNPTDGRWVNRDPIEEQGGLNLYAFVGNQSFQRIDYLGLTGSGTQMKSGDPIKCIEVKKIDVNWGAMWRLATRKLPFGKLPLPGDDSFGHWWIHINVDAEDEESKEEESYGYWPLGGVGAWTALMGVEGDMNGERNFGGSETRDPKHSQKDVYTTHPIYDPEFLGGDWNPVNWFVSRDLEYGEKKGTDCSEATVEDIQNCIQSFAKAFATDETIFGNPKGWSTRRNCQTFVKSVLDACCLED